MHSLFYTCMIYTGISSYTVLMELFMLVEKDLPHGHKLSKFNTFLMCLMKLRLNLHFEDRAYRFDVNITTASRRSHTVLNILYAKTKWLIHWPE